MCGRVRLSSDYSEIKIRLKFAPSSVAPNFEPDWNKPPTAPMLVAIRSVDGERVPKMMKWGLIAHWAKDDKLQYSTFNARAEEFAAPLSGDVFIGHRIGDVCRTGRKQNRNRCKPSIFHYTLEAGARGYRDSMTSRSVWKRQTIP
jgi:hypothetical protein